VRYYRGIFDMTRLSDKLETAMKAGTPFIKYSDMRDNQYRQRGGNPDSFPDKHPAYDISAHALPLGVWRALREAQADIATIIAALRERGE